MPPSEDRGDGRAASPWASVVVASSRERRLLTACLDSLLPQTQREGVETIVARAGGVDELEELRRSYPAVRFVQMPPGSSIPHLRARGMSVAGGDIVALTEDHCVVGPDWLEQLAGGHSAGFQIVGGAMDNAQTKRAVDWAAFFAEYGFFAERGGDATGKPLLTGANVSYARTAVSTVLRSAQEGDWENIAHSQLAAEGSAMEFLRTAAVYQNQNYDFGSFCRDRFQHGRAYARRRLANGGGSRRWLYLAGCPLLPLVLTYRVSRAIPTRHRRPFLRALPLTFSFLSAWSLGEAVGYWRGPSTLAV